MVLDKLTNIYIYYVNQAASYWSSVPHHPYFAGIGGHSPPWPALWLRHRFRAVLLISNHITAKND